MSKIESCEYVINAIVYCVQVVHNYGHGGGGITLHWGCANDATELVRQSLEQLNTKARL